MKKNIYPTFLFLLLFFLNSFKQAQAYDLGVSLGNLCEYVGKIQTDDKGSTNLCSFNPYLSTSFDYDVYPQLILSPEIGFSFPKTGRDQKISTMSFIALGNAKYTFSMFHFLAGAGFFINRIAGAGGTQDLNNGTGTVSFPMPESTIYSRNFILNLGLGADFNKDWSADVHTYIFNLLKSEDRAYSVALNGTYHFGEF
ncbi:MAG: hypothetical protein Q7U04_06860 [Bacteriovorax sp.]|nr:hypothetical protein [Bacteriovorax sp.]